MIQKVMASVQKKWGQIGLSGEPPAEFSFLVQNRKRIIYFLFDQKHPEPVVIVKVCRKSSQNIRMKRYVDLMGQLLGVLHDEVREMVSIPVELESIYGLMCTAERVLPGEPMELAGKDHPDILEAQVNQFQEKLLSFQSQAGSGSVLISPEKFDVVLPEHLHVLNPIFDTLRGLSMPIAWAFGDAHPSNILLKDNQITGWVDWEGVQQDQWIVMDWFQFQLSMALELVKKNYPTLDLSETIRLSTGMVLGLTKDPLSKIMIQSTCDFFDFYHLDHPLIQPLFLAFLTQYYWSPNKQETVSHTLRWVNALPEDSR